MTTEKDMAVAETAGYNGRIDDFLDYVNEQLDGIVAKRGGIKFSTIRGIETLDSVSIDRFPNLPEGYGADIVPYNSNGGYVLDFIVYVDKIGIDKFKAVLGGNGCANVEIDNNISSAIYDILMKEYGMQDLTLMPIVPKDSGATISEKIGRIQKRRDENRDKLYLYCNSNFGDRSGFVANIPQDPYQGFSLVKGWIERIQRING